MQCWLQKAGGTGLRQWPVPAFTSPKGERTDSLAEILLEDIPPLGAHGHLQFLHQVLITCTVWSAKVLSTPRRYEQHNNQSVIIKLLPCIIHPPCARHSTTRISFKSAGH